VFEKKVLRIFPPKKDERTSGYRKLHNEELHNFCCLLSVVRMIKASG
jgi:hypothetical protein